MPKINVYLPDDLAAAVRDAQVPVSAVCQRALERAVRDVSSLRASHQAPAEDEPARGMFQRFTSRARSALTRAEHFAREHAHASVGPEHVLLGVLDEGGNLAVKVLESLGIELDDLRAELIGSMAPGGEAVEGHIPFSAQSKQVLEATSNEAIALGHNYIGCEHILLGLIAVEDGLASEVLRRMGVEMVTTKRAITTALVGFVHAQWQAEVKPATADPLRQILERLDAIEKRLAS